MQDLLGRPISVPPVRAAVCNELGPPSVLRVEERPDPEPGPGQVVVAVEAAGVNFVDGLFVAGQYQIKPSLPFVPGSEVAGHVVGSRVRRRQRGGGRPGAGLGRAGWLRQPRRRGGALGHRPARRAGRGHGRPHSPRATARASSHCATGPMPRQARPCSFWAPAVASGWRPSGWHGPWAVGCWGSHRARTSGRRRSMPARRRSLDPAAEPVKEAARAWAGGTGVDLVVDPIGGALAEPALRALGDRGRYLVIGFASGDIPSVPLNQILLRNRSVIGIDWGIWAMTHSAEQRALLDDLLAMVGGGHPRPRPAGRVPARQCGRRARRPPGPARRREDRAGALSGRVRAQRHPNAARGATS